MSLLKPKYAVYMEVKRQTVDGDSMLARIRVAEGDDYGKAQWYRATYQSHLPDDIKAAWQLVLKLNPQAHAVKMEFIVAYEG